MDTVTDKEISGGNANIVNATIGMKGSTTGTAHVDVFEMKFQGDVTHLSGSTQTNLHGFDIDVTAPMSITQWFNKCTDPFKVHFKGSAGHVVAAGILTSGAFDMEFGFPDMSASLDAGYYNCEYEEPVHIPAVRANFKYWCPTWSEPGRICDGWTYVTPEINASIHMHATIKNVLVGNLQIVQVTGKANKDGIQLCHGKLRSISPNVFEISVGPTLNDSGNPVLNLARDFIDSVTEIVETSLTIVVGNVVALLSQTTVGEAFDLFGGC